MEKRKVNLPPEAVRAIELILLDGSTAEVRLMPDGISVTKIYRKRVFPN